MVSAPLLKFITQYYTIYNFLQELLQQIKNFKILQVVAEVPSTVNNESYYIVLEQNFGCNNSSTKVSKFLFKFYNIQT